jgi:hypothetical protein
MDRADAIRLKRIRDQPMAFGTLSRKHRFQLGQDLCVLQQVQHDVIRLWGQADAPMATVRIGTTPLITTVVVAVPELMPKRLDDVGI